MCDYSDTYTVVKEAINLETVVNNDMPQKDVVLKDALFKPCIIKIIIMLMDNANDLDKAMLMFSLLEYNVNYSLTSGRLWNYYWDKIDYDGDDASENKSSK